MEITQVHIDTFSILRQQTIPVLSPGITVFSGHNEAGKSTCLQFFKAMFFGYKRNNRFLEPITSRNASLTSGSLTIRTQHAGTIICTRLPKGECEISLPDGSPIQISLQQLLGNITAEMYDNVFALSLQQLMNVKSLQGENVRHALYGAAFGSGLRSPGAALKSLTEQMNALLRPKSGGSINSVLARLDAIAVERASHNEDLPEYIATEHALIENRSAWQKAMQERESTIRQLQKIRRRLVAWDNWEEFQSTQMALDLLYQQFPKLKLSHNLNRHSLQQCNLLLEKRETHTQSVASLQSSLVKLEEKYAALSQSAPFLNAQAEILALQEQKENMRQSVHHLDSLCQERKNNLKLLQKTYAVLGPQWNDDVLASIDFSLASREKYRQVKAAMAESSSLLKEKTTLLRSLQTEHARLLQEQTNLLQRYEKTKSELPDCPTETIRLFNKMPTLHHLSLTLLQQVEAISQREDGLTRALQGIAPNWDTEHLMRVDASAQTQEELSILAHKVTAAQTICAETEKMLQQATLRLETANHELHGCLEQIAALGTPRPEHDLNQIAQTIKQAEQMQHTLQVLQARDGRSQSKKHQQHYWITISFAIAAALSALTAFSVALPFLFWVTVLCGGCSLVSLMYTLWIKKLHRINCTRSQNLLDEEQHFLQASYDAQLATIIRYYPQLATASSPEIILLANELLAQEMQANIAAITKQTTKQTLENKVKEADFLVAQQKNLLEQAQTELALVENKWLQWLTAHHFPPQTSPAAAELIFERINAAQILLQNAEEAKQTLATAMITIQPILSEFSQSPFYRPHLETCPDLQQKSPFSKEYCQQLLSAITQLDAAASAVQALQENLALMHKFKLQLGDLADSIENLSKRIESLQGQVIGLEAQHKNATANWQAWLINMNLNPSLTSETAEEALEHILTAQNLHAAILASSQHENDIIQRVKEYTSAIEALYNKIQHNTAHTMAAQKSHQSSDAVSNFPELLQHNQMAEALLLLDELATSLRKGISDAAQQKQIQNQMEHTTASIEEANRLLQSTENQLSNIFTQTHTFDIQEFYQLYSAWEKEEEYKAQKLQQLAHLKRISHEESSKQEVLLEELENTGHEDLIALELQVATASKDLEEQCTTLQQEKGRLEERKRTLEHTSAITDLLQEEAMLITKLQEDADKWQALALSKYLIETAKEQFEAASQHNVLGTASRFFSRITLGEYTGISTQLDNELFFAVHASGQKRDPETELSQGTREQLYLSLRLAYIANHAQKAEPLPIILDDILVNFDPERAKQCAEILAEFALNNQILFFTCHPHLGEMILSYGKSIATTHNKPSHTPLSYLIEKGSISLL